MNQRYIDYAQYNIWANDRIANTLLLLEKQLLNKELPGSFPTIRKTLWHIWLAETAWLSRLNGKGWEATKVREFSGTVNELISQWKETSVQFKEFTLFADLETLVHFEQKDETFAIPAREIIQTVCNHGTYHRGQIVSMLRQLGITHIPQTDYIEWVREKERGNIISD